MSARKRWKWIAAVVPVGLLGIGGARSEVDAIVEAICSVMKVAEAALELTRREGLVHWQGLNLCVLGRIRTE